MADLQPFATVEDLEKYWRTLQESEQERAESLLELASNRLRLIARNQCKDLDQEAEDELFASVLKYVVLDAVKRAMNTPQDTPPVTDYSQTAGPYSENYKFMNPGGDLFFKKAELKSIGLAGQRLFGIITSQKDIYS